MTTASLLSDLEDLTDDLADLDETLSPLLIDSLPQTTKKLPLLDKAKLYVTTVYAIESLLFSYLKLQSATPSSTHPLTTEIARIKTYFVKLRSTETSSHGSTSSPANSAAATPNLTLNRAAAHRVITHALSGQEIGNTRINLEVREREAKEKLLSKRKESLERKLKESREALEKAVRKAEANKKGSTGRGDANEIEAMEKMKMLVQEQEVNERERRELSEEGEMEEDEDGEIEEGTGIEGRGVQTMNEQEYFATKGNRTKRKSGALEMNGAGSNMSGRREKGQKKAETSEKKRRKQSKASIAGT